MNDSRCPRRFHRQNVSAFNYQAGGGWYSYENGQWGVEVASATSLFAHLWTLSMREEWIDPQEGVNSEYSDLAEATELTQMPAGPTGERISFMGGACNTSFSDETAQYSAGPEISSNYIDYLTQPEQLNTYFQVAAPNFLPVRRGQEEMELFATYPTELPDSWLETRLVQGRNSARYGVTDADRCAPFLGSLEGSTSGYSYYRTQVRERARRRSGTCISKTPKQSLERWHHLCPTVSTALSGMIGSDADPKQALRDMGNNIRSAINDAEYIDYELEETTSGPSLDDAADMVQPWIEGDDEPQIYNPCCGHHKNILI